MNQLEKPIGLGVIGLGLRGDLAKQAHLRHQNVQVLAVADTNPGRFADAKNWFGQDLLCVTDYREMLGRKDIQAILVLSPDYLHLEHSTASLAAGKSVFLEKPMALDTQSCDAILREAAATRQKLYVGHNMRFMDFVVKMKTLIVQGAIGEVKTAWCRHFIAYGGDAYFRDWHAERSKTNSLLVQKACHDLDVLHWLCGAYSERIHAMGALMVYDRTLDRRQPGEPCSFHWDEANWPPLRQKAMNPIIDVEDNSMLEARLSNGILICYQQCHFAPDAWRNYTIIGTEGRIENIGYEAIRIWNHRQDKYWEGDVHIPSSYDSSGHGGADTLMMTEFLQFISVDMPTRNSPVAARYAVAAADAATQSLRHDGEPVEVPPLAPDLSGCFAGFGEASVL